MTDSEKKNTCKPQPHVRNGERMVKDGLPGWRLRAWDPRTQRQPEMTFYGTETEAYTALETFRNDLRKAPASVASDARNRLLAGFAVTFLKDYAWVVRPVNGNTGLKRPNSTYQNAKNTLTAYILPGLGPTTRLATITDEQCYNLVAGLKRKDGAEAAASTKEKTASILRLLLQSAVDAGLIDRSPAASLRTVWGHARRRTVVPSIRQVEQLARAMDREWRGRGDIVRVLAYTGMRWEELSALLWTDVDLTYRTISITKTATTSGGTRAQSAITKTSTSDRNIVIVDQAVGPLERLRALAERNLESVYVSSGRYGGPLNYSLWRKHLEKAQADSGVPYTAHELRHVAASMMIAAGASVEKVRNQMGHSRTSVTETVYRHAFSTDNRELARRLSQQVTELELVELDFHSQNEAMS